MNDSRFVEAWSGACFINRGGRVWIMSGPIWWLSAFYDFWCQVAIVALLVRLERVLPTMDYA